jgi:hypothetical protein
LTFKKEAGQIFTFVFYLLKIVEMKVILDIKESRAPFFIELINGLKYVRIIKQVSDKRKNREIQDIIDAFADVMLHEEGKKTLKSANQLLDEI